MEINSLEIEFTKLTDVQGQQAVILSFLSGKALVRRCGVERNHHFGDLIRNTQENEKFRRP
jgi:hypothetical protein